LRRIKSGIATARPNYSSLLAIHEETWAGETRSISASRDQSASRLIDVADDHVLLEVTLPWLLAKFAEKTHARDLQGRHAAAAKK
jgi:hypothetical protein